MVKGLDDAGKIHIEWKKMNLSLNMHRISTEQKFMTSMNTTGDEDSCMQVPQSSLISQYSEASALIVINCQNQNRLIVRR